MTAAWNFYPQLPTDPVHNPISGEFFSAEAVGDLTEALIREGIQNTLDARKRNEDGSRHTAEARIFLSELEGALSAPGVHRWFSTLWPHVSAPGNGLRNQPEREAACPFLVFEDFGTTGLTGSPDEHRVIDGVTNHFLNFFRAEGHSDKGEQDRGSWGVGKTVFPGASRISSFFGLTVRGDDGGHLLLGRSILKYHSVRGQPYKSDGYFGERRPDDGFMLPSSDPATLSEFLQDFRVKRQNESGLSIVVPWYEINGDDGITRDKVIAAVLRGFFYPILMGHLKVTVATPGEEISLDAGSIMSRTASVGGALADELLPMLRLAEWGQTRVAGEFQMLTPPEPMEAQKWSAGLVPPAVMQHVRQSLAQRQRVSFHVPMAVQRKGWPPTPTFFRIYLEHSEGDSESPLFIREELIIPDVRPQRVPNVRAMVVIEDGPLAAFLRDAETPAHTQWTTRTSNFSNKYVGKRAEINFVRYSVSELLRIVNQAEQKPDPSITIDFFSISAEPEDIDAVPARRRKAKEKGEETQPDDFEAPVRSPRRFRIEALRGGFRLVKGDAPVQPPMRLRVRVAYDVRRGAPLRKFHPADVDPETLRHEMYDDSVAIDSANAEAKKGLILLITIRKPDFRLDCYGFDPDRDLYVRADEVKEVRDAN